LISQLAVEDEFDAWLGQARYERRPDHQRGLRNYESRLRNGFRPRKVQTLEGELEVEIRQVREAADPFVSSCFRAARRCCAPSVAGDGDRLVRRGPSSLAEIIATRSACAHATSSACWSRA
jgi:hypothetical protein